MALDPRFTTAPDLQTYFVKKDDGSPNSGGKVYFFRDIARTIPKDVYQITGSPPDYSYAVLPNPLTLSSVGTPQNNNGADIIIYFFPYDGTPFITDNIVDLYYIEVYDEDGHLQFTRQGWPNVLPKQQESVTSVFGRTGDVVAQTGDYTAAQVTNAANLIATNIQSFTNGLIINSGNLTLSTGNLNASAIHATGITGTTTGSRYVGATASGSPTSGTFLVGDYIIDQSGSMWVCTDSGSPGTWVEIGSHGNIVTSVFGRTGNVTAQSGDYTAAQVIHAANLIAPSTQTFSNGLTLSSGDLSLTLGNLNAIAIKAIGLTGANAVSRYVGATASGSPTSGSFLVGDFVVDQTGTMWVCTVAGTPGTWVNVGSSESHVNSVFGRVGAVVAQAGDYVASQVTNAADLSAGSIQIFSSGLRIASGNLSLTLGSLDAVTINPSGLIGATAASRYVGATASGAPIAGTFVIGDFVIDRTGKIWVCTVGGTPGTWTNVGSSSSLVSSVFGRTGAVVAQSGDYTAAQVTNAADLTAVSIQTFANGLTIASGNLSLTLGSLNTVSVNVTGLTGATAVSRYVGATASGAPVSGTFAVGDFVVDQTGKIWVCTTAGSPGTWTNVGSSSSLVNSVFGRTGSVIAQTGDYMAAQVTNAADLTAVSTQTFANGLTLAAGNLTAVSVISTGLTGATAGTRYVGATASGAPVTGTFVEGDFIVDRSGKMWVCITAGTPGVWSNVGSSGSLVNSVFGRTGSVVAQSGDYTAAQVTNAADLTAVSTQTFANGLTLASGNLTAPAIALTGLTGATAASRYVGATSSGAPASGSFLVGDFIVDRTGSIWICTIAGTPGTWLKLGGNTAPNEYYLPLINTPSGQIADLSRIGEIIGTIYSPSYISSFPLLKCDGATYIYTAYSPLGIPYARLGDVLMDDSPVQNIPKFGTGLNYATAYAFTGITSSFRITVNNPIAGVSNAIPGTTGWTISNTTTSTAFRNIATYTFGNNGLFAKLTSSTTALELPGVQNTAGFTFQVFYPTGNFDTSLLAFNSYSFTITTLSGSSLANPGGPGKAFSFSTDTTKYYVWYKFTNETDPGFAGYTPIPIDLSANSASSYSVQDIAYVTREAIGTYTITTINVTSAVTAGQYFRFNANPPSNDVYIIWYQVNGAGTPPVIPGIKIAVSLTTSEASVPSIIVSKTQKVINQYSYAVPNIAEGQFLRGHYNSTGIDPDGNNRFSLVSGMSGPIPGTFQEDQFRSHLHENTAVLSGTGYLAQGSSLIQEGPGTNTAQAIGMGSVTVNMSNVGSGGQETRPRNFSVAWYIYY